MMERFQTRKISLAIEVSTLLQNQLFRVPEAINLTIISKWIDNYESMGHKLKTAAEKFLSAWNSQNPTELLSVYADHFSYKDPNTNGPITDKTTFRKYLDKLFQSWEMNYTLKKCFPLQANKGATIIWKATFKKKGRSQVVKFQGMDIVLFKNGLVTRNEVFFDRIVLMPIASPLITKIQELSTGKLVKKNPLIREAVQLGKQITNQLTDRLPGDIAKGRAYFVKKQKEVRKFFSTK